LAQQAAPAAGGASDLAQLYAQGMSEFQAGDYAKAAADLDALLVKAEFSPQLEPAFFTVGSAYFNVPDHKKAIAAFKNYLAKFPNGPHVAEVSYAIGQAHFLSKNYSEAVAQFSTVEKDPRYREQALFFGATASKEGGGNRSGNQHLGKVIRRGIKDAYVGEGRDDAGAALRAKGQVGQDNRRYQKAARAHWAGRQHCRIECDDGGTG